MIFGEVNYKYFFDFKNIIDESDFDYNKIKNLFFYKSGRWDIETDNGILIRLPKEIMIEIQILIWNTLKTVIYLIS